MLEELVKVLFHNFGYMEKFKGYLSDSFLKISLNITGSTSLLTLYITFKCCYRFNC